MADFGGLYFDLKYIVQNLIKLDQIFFKYALHKLSFNLSLVILMSLKQKVIKSVCELGRNTMKHLLYVLVSTQLYRDDYNEISFQHVRTYVFKVQTP